MQVRDLFTRLALSCLLATPLAMASEVGTKGNGATGELRFGEASYDFGAIKRGVVVERRFSFTNVGRGPLQIYGIHASCGCATIETDAGRQYQAGEKGDVVVKLDTSHFRGSLVKTVTVMTNAKVMPETMLTLRAQVVDEINATPPVLDFGEITVEAPVTKYVRVDGGTSAQVTGLRYDKNKFDVVMKNLKPGQWELGVTLLPGGKSGFLSETILVLNSSEALKELPVLVRGHVLPNLSHTPNYLEFGPISARQKVVRSLSIAGRKEFSLKAARTELNVNGRAVANPETFIKVDLSQEHSDKARQLAVALINAQGLTGSVHGRLVLATNDQAQGDLSVDFYAFFQE